MLRLEKLPDDILWPLTTLVAIPPHALASGNHAPWETKIHMNIASNKLKRLPATLFRLNALLSLTVRNNKLSELPPTIGAAQRLMELNIAQNNLHYLPYEILNLWSNKCFLEHFRLHPNPFYQPHPAPSSSPQSDSKGASGRDRRVGSWILKYVCRSETRYFDNRGLLVKGPIWPHERPDDESSVESVSLMSNAVSIEGATGPSKRPEIHSGHASIVPSLVEIALRGCSKHPLFTQLHEALPPDCPEHVLRLLSEAKAVKEDGGRKCTVCQRDFITASIEWIEWWQIYSDYDVEQYHAHDEPSGRKPRDAYERNLPLMRRGCSWLCGPDGAELQDEAVN